MIWERDYIGKVICADSLQALSSIPEKSIDLIVTDPPYGHNNNDGDLIANWEAVFGGDRTKSKPRPIAQDGVEANELYKQFLKEAFRVLKPGSCCCCCGGGGGPDPQFARWSLWMDEVFQFKHMVVWDKGGMGLGHHYRRSYETILVGQKPGAACKWYDKSKRIENVIRPGMYGIHKIIPNENQHPTEKPVELMQFFIELHSTGNDIVLDPFCGHGSTLLAARKLGRRFIGIDVDAGFCEISRKKLAELHGATTEERAAAGLPMTFLDTLT